MTIEQVLMRSLKTSGGLTRGRGITDLLNNVEHHARLIFVLFCPSVNYSVLHKVNTV